jgi:hypothetical protein
VSTREQLTGQVCKREDKKREEEKEEEYTSEQERTRGKEGRSG